jgi:hypothetical protein
VDRSTVLFVDHDFAVHGVVDAVSPIDVDLHAEAATTL